MMNRNFHTLTIGLVLLVAGCGKPHSTPSTLTAREKTELETALKRLDDVLVIYRILANRDPNDQNRQF